MVHWTKETNCYYCGSALSDYSGKAKRRKDVSGWHLLHAACATDWDNEGRRL